MQNTPFASIVIPTFKRKEKLEKLLNSLFIQSYPTDKFEIIVIDDGSKDGTEDLVKLYQKKRPPILKYFCQRHKGPAAARNLGIKKAKGEFIAFIDDDCIAQSNWLQHILTGYDDNFIAGIGGTINGVESNSLISQYLEYTRIMEKPVMKGQKVEYLAGTNTSFKREILNFIGGFNEEIPLGGEDLDLSFRIRSAGYLLKYNPSAAILHFHKETLKDFLKTFYNYGKGSSIFYLKNRQNKISVLYIYLKAFLSYWKIPIEFRENYAAGINFKKNILFSFLSFAKKISFSLGGSIGFLKYILKPFIQSKRN